MTTQQPAITWPAVIQYHGDPELERIETAREWADFLASAAALDAADRLIDSKGLVFTLLETENDRWVSQGKLSLEDVLGLVKAHLADSGACCVAKTYAPSIHQAIAMVFNNSCDINQPE